MGTDKIDHFFQQGHEYYARIARREAAGIATAEAIPAAVARGVKQEHKWFGTLASGVYSNADLAANYAGMKFYLNLRRPVLIGDRVWPPLFFRAAEGWRLRPGVDPDRLLEPFLSDHLDESLNPSRFRFSRATIRSHVRARCAQWTHFYADRLGLVAASGQSFATTWFGEDYGHWLPPAQEISIETECGPVFPRSLTRILRRQPESTASRFHRTLPSALPPSTIFSLNPRSPASRLRQRSVHSFALTTRRSPAASRPRPALPKSAVR
jgi:hypothetical protein